MNSQALKITARRNRFYDRTLSNVPSCLVIVMKINEIYQKIKNLILTKTKKFTSTEISFISEFVFNRWK